MSRGVNLVIILGRLGKDPEIKYLLNGNAVANFSMATEESWKDKQTGEQQTKTEWHRVTAFQRLAEIIGEYVHKGDQIYIKGKIQTRQYEKDGETRYITEIIAQEMQMLGSKKDSQRPRNEDPGKEAAAQNMDNNDSFDDDIPF